MNINILRYSLFGIAGGQEVDRSFVLIAINSHELCKQQLHPTNDFMQYLLDLCNREHLGTTNFFVEARRKQNIFEHLGAMIRLWNNKKANCCVINKPNKL